MIYAHMHHLSLVQHKLKYEHLWHSDNWCDGHSPIFEQQQR